MMLNSWLCPGSLDGHHVFTWTGSSTRPDYWPSGYCQCGQAYYDAQEKRITLMFPHHLTVNPFVPHAPQPTPAAPDVPLQQFKAAQEEGATHLSTDGKTAYDQRQYSIYRCFWDQEEKRFGGWWKFEGELPTDAVLLDKEQL